MSNEGGERTESRQQLQEKLAQLKAARDQLQEESRFHAQRRDELNQKVRESNDAAAAHRTKRDEINEQVRKLKLDREEANHIATEAQLRADALRAERLPGGAGAPNVAKLKQEARHLEYRQMTEVMTKAKEQALIERLQEIGRVIRDRDASLRKDPELRVAIEEAERLREQAEAIHKKVGELATQAQAEHEAMIQIYKRNDGVRREADQYQEKFVVAKLEADKFHGQYVDVLNAIREMDGESPQSSGGEGGEEIARMAKEVFQRFQSGEKLSTEDLMVLQRAGLL